MMDIAMQDIADQNILKPGDTLSYRLVDLPVGVPQAIDATLGFVEYRNASAEPGE